MSVELVLLPSAEVDVKDAAQWYERQRGGLGAEFVAAVEETFDRAVTNPAQFQRLRLHPEIRRALTDRFPYRVFFVVRSTAIVVFRVLHVARHDREWRRYVPGEGDD
jgi:toxin ParE1/3/4